MRADDPRHGTHAGAIAHWKGKEKPCDPCATAARRAAKGGRLDRHRGNARTVPLGQAAWQIIDTTPRGQLFRATGIRVDKLLRLHKKGPEGLVHRRTRDILLDASGKMFWTPIGIQRRLQALTAAGWSMQALAAHMGRDLDGLKRLRSRAEPQFVRNDFAEAIIAAYDELAMQQPTGRGPARARSDAAREGWASPLAWNDIDDPNETPDSGYKARKNRPIAELLTEWEHLRGFGLSVHHACQQLGVTYDAITVAMSRRDGAA